jgi:glycerol kinase
MNVLAIDQGTSGTKAIVVGADGTVLAVAEQDIHPVYLDGGGVEQDPHEMLASVIAVGKRAAADAGVPLDAVALANQGETVLAWDRATGTPLSRAIVWQDSRSQAICTALSSHTDIVRERTGLVLDPYFSAPKMRWLRDHVTTDGVVTTSDTWLINQLCGAFVTDASTASRSLLLDLDRVEWSNHLIDVFGLGSEQLPDIVACDDVVGSTSVFGGDLPVTGLIVDQQAALLGEGCLTPGTAKSTYGTGAFLLANTGDAAARSTAGLTTSVAWRLRNESLYCIDGQVYTAASAVRWLIDLGLLDSADQLDATAAASSDGVICVPALAGLAAPWWDATASAVMAGMTLSSTRGHIVRAVVEGIATQVALLASMVADDLGAPLTRLRVDGGLTRSAALMQAQADIAQLPVDVFPHPHATAAGAATCARLALDTDLTIVDAVGAWTPTRTYEPQWSPDRADDHVTRWNRAAQAALSPS